MLNILFFSIFLSQSNFRFKYDLNVYWMKIFHHNSTGNIYFNSKSEALSCNSEKKFSLLGNLGEYDKIDGFFEFLLEYPELSGYNRWKQEVNPLLIAENSNLSPATGYQPISISWNGSFWGGLVKSSHSDTFLDGSTNIEYYWYSIGQLFDYKNTGGFPGPNNIIVKECILWLRISPNNINHCSKLSNLSYILFFPIFFGIFFVL